LFTTLFFEWNPLMNMPAHYQHSILRSTGMLRSPISIESKLCTTISSSISHCFLLIRLQKAILCLRSW
jgi:hypothetical protein